MTQPTETRSPLLSVDALAARLGSPDLCIVDCRWILNQPGAGRAAYEAAADFNPLFEQATVQYPEKNMNNDSQAPFAVGLIETQGFTAVFEAIDTALKTAAVEVLAREKLGGGYITVLIKGDVAAVQAAIDAGKAKVEGLGKLIAAHVIARPSAGVLALLPK